MLLLDLPDDTICKIAATGACCSHVWSSRFYACCKRLLALASRRRTLFIQPNEAATAATRVAYAAPGLRMFTPYAWAARFSGLQDLCVEALTVGERVSPELVPVHGWEVSEGGIVLAAREVVGARAARRQAGEAAHCMSSRCVSAVVISAIGPKYLNSSHTREKQVWMLEPLR